MRNGVVGTKSCHRFVYTQFRQKIAKSTFSPSVRLAGRSGRSRLLTAAAAVRVLTKRPHELTGCAAQVPNISLQKNGVRSWLPNFFSLGSGRSRAAALKLSWIPLRLNQPSRALLELGNNIVAGVQSVCGRRFVSRIALRFIAHHSGWREGFAFEDLLSDFV